MFTCLMWEAEHWHISGPSVDIADNNNNNNNHDDIYIAVIMTEFTQFIW